MITVIDASSPGSTRSLHYRICMCSAMCYYLTTAQSLIHVHSSYPSEAKYTLAASSSGPSGNSSPTRPLKDGMTGFKIQQQHGDRLSKSRLQAKYKLAGVYKSQSGGGTR